MDFWIILYIIDWILFIGVAFTTLYMLLFSIASLFAKHSEISKAKRQNRFIGKELERRKQLKEFKEVLAVRKQEARIEQEEDNMVHELLDEI